jgi:hypothetical protein
LATQAITVPAFAFDPLELARRLYREYHARCFWNSPREREKASELFRRLPEDEIGCIYLDKSNRPVTPDPDSPEFRELTRHFGSVGGSWPVLSGDRH